VLGPVGRAPFLAVYAMLPAAAVLVALVQLRGGWARHNVVLPFVVVGAIGPLVYLLFPVVGPAFAFGPEGGSFAVTTGWPGQPLIPNNPRPVSFDAVTPRNCVPSLHTAWAVVLFLHTRSMARWLRIMGAAWLVVTLLATLGFGTTTGWTWWWARCSRSPSRRGCVRTGRAGDARVRSWSAPVRRCSWRCCSPSATAR